MIRMQYTFTKEPRDHIYESLLDLAVNICDTALLVVRNQRSMSNELESTIALLQSFELDRREASEWPGTTLHGRQALVIRYAFGIDLAAILKTVTQRLYSWQHPDLPEDLCLLRADGTSWLVSIAHEHDAYLEMSQTEHSSLIASIPEIEFLLSNG